MARVAVAWMGRKGTAGYALPAAAAAAGDGTPVAATTKDARRRECQTNRSAMQTLVSQRLESIPQVIDRSRRRDPNMSEKPYKKPSRDRQSNNQTNTNKSSHANAVLLLYTLRGGSTRPATPVVVATCPYNFSYAHALSHRPLALDR